MKKIILTVLLWMPILASAGDYRDYGDYRGERPRRPEIHVTNDWRDLVRITLWKERGERVSKREWLLESGESAYLANEDGRRLHVSGSDKIKVGEDWGRVRIEDVGYLRDGVWRVNVRDIWQATHQDRPRREEGRKPHRYDTWN